MPRLPVRIDLGPGALFRLAGANRGNAFLERNFELPLRPGRVVEVGDRYAREALPHRALDAPQVLLLVRRDEGERVAGHLGARRASNAVDVILRHLGNVEVHHMPECLDVDAARGDVRRHEHAKVAALEAVERRRALRLAPVAVNALGLDAVLHQILVEPVGAMLRAREDQRLLHHVLLEQGKKER